MYTEQGISSSLCSVHAAAMLSGESVRILHRLLEPFGSACAFLSRRLQICMYVDPAGGVAASPPYHTLSPVSELMRLLPADCNGYPTLPGLESSALREPETEA